MGARTNRLTTWILYLVVPFSSHDASWLLTKRECILYYYVETWLNVVSINSIAVRQSKSNGSYFRYDMKVFSSSIWRIFEPLRWHPRTRRGKAEVNNTVEIWSNTQHQHTTATTNRRAFPFRNTSWTLLLLLQIPEYHGGQLQDYRIRSRLEWRDQSKGEQEKGISDGAGRDPSTVVFCSIRSSYEYAKWVVRAIKFQTWGVLSVLLLII